MLLFRSSRLWYCLRIRTNNTEAHAVCIIMRDYARDAYILMSIFVLLCFGYLNLPDSDEPKQSA